MRLTLQVVLRSGRQVGSGDNSQGGIVGGKGPSECQIAGFGQIGVEKTLYRRDPVRTETLRGWFWDRDWGSGEPFDKGPEHWCLGKTCGNAVWESFA